MPPDQPRHSFRHPQDTHRADFCDLGHRSRVFGVSTRDGLRMLRSAPALSLDTVAAGVGTIDLDPHTITQLRLHRRRQLEQRMATGHRHTDDYVFTKPDGSPIHPDLISQTFERIIAKAQPSPHPPTRSAPHPRHDPAATRHQPQSRQRTPRPRQRLIHHGRLPTRPTRHASPSRSHLRNRHLRRTLNPTPGLGSVVKSDEQHRTSGRARSRHATTTADQRNIPQPQTRLPRRVATIR